MFKPLVSIIIVDYKKNNPYLVECLNGIRKQTYKNFEVILVCDYKVNITYPNLRQKYYGHYVGPAEKRDEGARMAKGEILAFIDDDAYPSPKWLESLVPHFKNIKIAGVGGPGVTPPGVSWQEEASGWASASPMGAGPYIYRFLPDKKQCVDDYPSMNLSVRKADFDSFGGYDSSFWPGEDTKLCLDITHKINKKIIYEPKALVYHHRRPIWIGHLRQNGNFGLHRGFFARILPKTSRKPVYFLPSLLIIGLFFLAVSLPLSSPIRLAKVLGVPGGIYTSKLQLVTGIIQIIGIVMFLLYIIILIFNSIWIFNKSKSLLQSLLSIPVIFITHLWYGFRFIQGFLFTAKLIR